MHLTYRDWVEDENPDKPTLAELGITSSLLAVVQDFFQDRFWDSQHTMSQDEAAELLMLIKAGGFALNSSRNS